MLLRTLAFAVVGAGMVANAAAGAEYVHPKLKSRQKIVKSVYIVPARVEINRLGIKGAEPMVKESEELGEQLARLVASGLKQQGIAVREDLFGSDESERKYALADLQARYDKVSAQLHRQPKDVRKGRFSMGDDVATVRGGGSSPDALVFVRSHGTVLTGGKKTFGWLVAGPTGNGVVSYVSLVDANSGEVLFVSVLSKGGNFVGDPDKTWTNSLASAFQNIPR